MTMLKNQRHETFAQEYVLNGGNASEAYRKTYPSCRNLKDKTVWERACRLAKNRKVDTRIKELQEERRGVYDDAAADIISLCRKVLRGEDVTDYKQHTEGSDGKETTTHRTVSKTWAAECARRMLGLDMPAQTKQDVTIEDKTIDKININVVYNKSEDIELQDRRE